MKMDFDFAAWTDARLLTVEQALDAWVPLRAPAGLGDGMRYAVLDGGKRLRPLLVLAARESVALGQTHEALDDAALRAACAVELIHAYSLVHDDMPCMDNDVLRRGKPTVHVAYDEATALLVGDALQSQAFLVLAEAADGVPPARLVGMLRLLAHASGPNLSDDRRIGLAIRYIPPHVRQLKVRDSAMLVRGRDTRGNFDLETPPRADFDAAARAAHATARPPAARSTA